jgi:hypothetical protein
MSRDLTGRQVVDAFIAHRATTDHPGIQVECRPDEVERNDAAIDAIAGPLAIEHTSIDTVKEQRRDDARFMAVVAELGAELGSAITSCVSLLFPYDGVQVGQDWFAMKASLRAWIVGEAPNLPDGIHAANIPGVPFSVRVEKAGPATGRQPGLFFMRMAPPEPDLTSRLRALIERKTAKLAPHRAQGQTTSLIVESDDIALMNRSKLASAVASGFASGLPPELDELWYADTSVPRHPPPFARLDSNLPAAALIDVSD